MASFTQTYDFDTASDYTYDPTQIEFPVGEACSVLQGEAGTFTQDFTSDTGFTYDSSLTEFTGGKVQQIDQRDADAVLGASYTSSKDANWADGSTTSTDVGSPVITSNKLDCTGNNSTGVYYDVTGYDAGTIKFKYTPNYTGNPPNNVDVVGLEQASGNNNRVGLTHSPSGDNWRFWANNSSGGAEATATQVGANGVGLVSGTEYEIEFSWDAGTGDVYVFMDGTLYGSINIGSWTRIEGSIRLYIGSNPFYSKCDASFADVIYYDAVQHTTSYTPGYTVPENIYLTDLITLPSFTYTGVGSILSFTSFTTTEAGTPRYIINDEYWDGGAWSSSDGSYAQASTASDISTNLGTANVADTIVFKLRFDDSNIISDVDQLNLGYTGETYPTDNPTITANTKRYETTCFCC